MSITQDWKLYENGKKYNNSLKPNYYSTVDTNIAFVNGDQWRNVEANGMPTPVFNIMKRALTFFVAFLTSSKYKLKFEPLAYADDDNDPNTRASEIANAEVENLFDKFKMDFKIRDACFDAGTIGDVAAHIYFDYNKIPYGGAFKDINGGIYADLTGEIEFELIDGTSIFFGNANNPSTDVNVQPYIIVQGREVAKKLKEEAAKFNKSEAESVKADEDYEFTAGDAGKIEVESDEYGKATYIIVYKYDSETKTIKVSKCTKNAYMYKDIDTGLSHYPIAWLPWEKQKNQYHGRAFCTGVIPNQIFINRMFAMVMYHLMMSAFPKAVYDADRIEDWTNEIGAAIPVNGINPGENITGIAGYLDAGNMSNQIVEVIDLAIKYTKETLGINDAVLGNINPENASGKSIITTVQQSSIPIETTKSNVSEWIEDIGKILLDMMGTYYGLRPIVMNMNGQRGIVEYDFSVFKNLFLNVKADVGASSYWSEISNINTLDNLLNTGKMDIITYLESIPEGYIQNRDEIVAKLKMNMMATMPPMPNEAPAM